jgi:hypothetical protein
LANAIRGGIRKIEHGIQRLLARPAGLCCEGQDFEEVKRLIREAAENAFASHA